MFMAIGFLVTVLNVLTFLALRRRLIRAFPKRGNLASIVAGVCMLILLHPALFMLFGGMGGLMSFRQQVPQWGQIAAMSFQLATWLYGAVLLIKATPGAFLDAARRLKRLLSKTADKPDKEEIDHDRRRALTKAGLAVPAAIIATTAGGAIAARQAPVITRLKLKVPRELTNLHGLTIAQVSDVHIGSYMGPDRLDEFRDAMNALKADFHVMTGDLLDNDISQMEEARRFLRGLKPKRGQVFMCMGNHEYIPARDGDIKPIIDGLRETGTQLLIDQAQKIDVGGDHFWMGGIDYPHSRGIETVHSRTPQESLDVTLGEMNDDGAPRIVLAHHPKSFEVGRDMPLDLMLSGHTHGGQLVLGRIGDYNFSPVLPFELYHNGYYQHEGRALYVNRGAGGWMPVRINCPPEISLIEFVAEA
ncbi:MAG: metallophosphoesterase [Planctomycetes bacterium]|nr:metallophosphoesterase [Planctomycetota bacterium]